MNPGDVVAERYEIGRLAGSGGMGAVYVAHDRLSGESVALKVLLGAGTRNPERFMREGRVLAELSHPGIVKYVAHGTTPAGLPYLVMEWLEGETLADRLTRLPLTLGESLALARRVAETLVAAHAKGVIHRDIKPSNLFLPACEIDRLKLLDFGLARLGNATRAGTATGALLGTPGYMAPEQAMGERNIDARADIFSVGCVLFECLTGRHAFVAENLMGMLAKIVLEDAPRTRDVRAEIPLKLDDLVARMLSKDPARRPGTASALVAKLDELGTLSVEDSRAAPSSGFQPRITEREQRLISIVLAGTSTAPDEVAHAETVEISADTKSLDVARRVALRFGGRFEWLADGSLIGTIEAQGTATDQAAQAARCALAIRAQLTDVPIVLATGRSVVAGHLPVGEVIDRSTRLLEEHAASRKTAAGTPIRIDQVTAGLLDTRFEVGGDSAGLVLLGEREPVDVTRKLLGKPTACVGREREVKTLEAIFEECVSEPVSRAVVVTAPAGIGKSRLRYEFLRHLKESGEAVEIWIGRGDPMSAGSPFAMLAAAIRRAAGIRENEPLGVRQQKLLARVSRHVPSSAATRVTEFLGELVGTPFTADAVQLRAARQEPVLMGDQMRRAFEDFLAAECAAQPVLLVLEDLHWGDLPTVKFVDAALRTLHDRPLMVLALARPEIHELFPRLWAERRMQEIRLEELTKRAAEKLVREALGESATPELVLKLVTRSAGNAFYLEELIRAVSEGKGDALPETVIAMAQARLDALDPEARRILRAASIFGETFWRGGVFELLGGERRTTQSQEWLDELVQREVITARPEPKFDGELEYAFRHALVREAAYASLTDSDRKLGHKLAGGWLEKVDERDAMVVAEHFERGGEPLSAVRYYLAGAEHALQGNDFTAALARAERGVACGAEGVTLGSLRLLQAESHRWIGEFTNAEKCGALALEHLPPRTTLWYVTLGELASASGLVGNLERLIAVSESLKEAGATDPGSAPLVIASARAAVQLLHLGKYAIAEEFLNWLDGAAKLVADDPAVLGWVGRARTIQAGKSGDTDMGRRSAQSSAASLEAAGDLRTACLQRMNLGYYQNELGLYADAETTLRSALSDAARLGLHHVTAPGLTFLGYSLVGLGKLEEAMAAEREAIVLFLAQGDKRMEAASRNHLSRALLGLGKSDEAIAEGRAAVDLCAKVPSMRATSCAALATALLEARRAEDALAVAREGMEILKAMGGIDQGEARLRLAHALALDATSEHAAAVQAIAVARDRILARAAGVSESAAKSGFLESVAENARTLELAAAWVDRGERGERSTMI